MSFYPTWEMDYESVKPGVYEMYLQAEFAAARHRAIEELNRLYRAAGEIFFLHFDPLLGVSAASQQRVIPFAENGELILDEEEWIA